MKKKKKVSITNIENTATDSVEHLEIDTIDNVVNYNVGIMFIECYKYSKGPIFIIEPIMKKLHETKKLDFKQYRVNLLEQPDFEKKYQIVGEPCYLIFHGNQLVDKIYGITFFYNYIRTLIE